MLHPAVKLNEIEVVNNYADVTIETTDCCDRASSYLIIYNVYWRGKGFMGKGMLRTAKYVGLYILL